MPIGNFQVFRQKHLGAFSFRFLFTCVKFFVSKCDVTFHATSAKLHLKNVPQLLRGTLTRITSQQLLDMLAEVPEKRNIGVVGFLQ